MTAEGTRRAVFEGGRVEADVVVAADGIHSVARAERFPAEGPPRWNGSLLWRGVAETDAVLDGRTMVWAGHPEQKFVGYPIADLPGGKQAFNFVAELRRPESDLAATEDWNKKGSLGDFLPQFEAWDFGWLDVPSVVRAAPATYLFPMVDRDPLPRWTFGRSTLLGDAAHPMYPIGSNGASQAILDARVLAGCVRRHPGNLDEALDHYEKARRPATAAIVRANRGHGPELPMVLVEERAPEGFTDIADVITRGGDRAGHRGVPEDGRFLPRLPPAGDVAARPAVWSVRTMVREELPALRLRIAPDRSERNVRRSLSHYGRNVAREDHRGGRRSPGGLLIALDIGGSSAIEGAHLLGREGFVVPDQPAEHVGRLLERAVVGDRDLDHGKPDAPPGDPVAVPHDLGRVTRELDAGLDRGAAPPCAQMFTWCRAASTTGATETWLTLFTASSIGIEKPKSRSIRGADDTNPWRDT